MHSNSCSARSLAALPSAVSGCGDASSLADSIPFLVKVQIIMGFCALFSLVLYGMTFNVMQWLMKTLPRTDSGYALFNLSSGAIAVAIMFPTAFCAGMTLPLLTTALIRKGHGERSIGAVYAANTLGAILGVFFAIHIGMPWLGLKGLMTAGAGLDIALGIALLWSARSFSGSRRIAAAITAICISAVVRRVYSPSLTRLDWHPVFTVTEC